MKTFPLDPQLLAEQLLERFEAFRREAPSPRDATDADRIARHVRRTGRVAYLPAQRVDLAALLLCDPMMNVVAIGGQLFQVSFTRRHIGQPDVRRHASTAEASL